MTIIDDVRALLNDAIELADDAHVPQLRELERRLDSPLRLAIAGKVKAGKSTLLNALVGEAVAPTDAAECTKVVTWYVDGLTYRAWMHPLGGGDPSQIPFRREAGSAEIDIGDTDPTDIERLVVEFPSQNLAGLNLIDTPGTASISESVSLRTDDFLLPATSAEVDVVLYLMRHLHDGDVDFLEAFAGEGGVARPTMAIGILSRADELGGGRSDAMEIADQVAADYANDTRLRSRLQTVVPIAGLLGFAAATLRQEEFQQLRVLAREPIDVIDRVLATVDSFVSDPGLDSAAAPDRRALLDRLGLHGVRFAVAAILHGNVSSAQELADALEAHSGLRRLRSLVGGLFADRQVVVKADLALGLVEAVARTLPRADGRGLLGGVERIRATAHEFAELDALRDLRADGIDGIDEELRDEAERILGAHGADVVSRLALEGDLDAVDVRAAVLESIEKWRRLGDGPLVTRALRSLSSVVSLTLDRLYGELADD